LNDTFDPIEVLLNFAEIGDSETGENILEWFVDQLEFWKLNIDDIIGVVTDNGPNMLKFCKLLVETHPQICTIPCAPHTLQLVIFHALRPTIIPNLVIKVRSICTKLNKGFKWMDKYKEICANSNPPVHPLLIVSDVSTRWNSTYFMIQSFLKRRQYYRQLYTAFDRELPLTNIEISVLRNVYKLLKPCFR